MMGKCQMIDSDNKICKDCEEGPGCAARVSGESGI